MRSISVNFAASKQPSAVNSASQLLERELYMSKQRKRQSPQLIIFLFVTLVQIGYCSVAKADAIDSMRHKWTSFLIGQASAAADAEIKRSLAAQDAEASGYLETMAKDTVSRTGLWKDFTYAYSKDITASYRRLFLMALAYQSPDSKLFHNIQLKQAVFIGLAWLYAHHYNEAVPLPIPANGSDVHNWWDYKIGTPLQLDNTVLLLYDELPLAQRTAYMRAVEHFTPDWTDRYTRKPATVTFTAANRVWVSTVIGLRGLILKDATRLKAASDSLSSVFSYVISGDGFYPDGSFIQHVKHPYTGGYGVSLLNTLAEEIYLFSGTPWAVDQGGVQHVYQWLYNAFAPIIFKGNLMSMVEGREISRPDAQGDRKGELVVQAIALLAKAAPAAEQARLRGLVTYWFKNRPFRTDFYAHMSGNYISIVKALRSDSQAVQLPASYVYRQFAHMDRAVQHTPSYAFGISMYSSRIYNYETRTNYENIKGWHTSDGQTYLYNDDTEQYNDDFWATVNYNHLPGTTVETGSKIPGFKTSAKDWVGGVALLDRYGVSGMDLAAAGQTLTAKKSWFMLDGKIVALGAGIASQDSAEVNTYVEQRKLGPDNTDSFSVNGKAALATDGSGVFERATWAHLSGHVPGAAIGYYFPNATTLHAARAAQSGAWHDVNVNYHKKTITHQYLTLWTNHKQQPEYAYVLLPGFTAAATQAYAEKPDVQVLANTSAMQAVESASLHLVAANFWAKNRAAVNASHQQAYLSCDGQAAVMVLKSADKLYIALSDPTMRGGNVVITVKEKVERLMTGDPDIKIVSLKPYVRLSINGERLHGRTANLVLATTKE
ncbi:MAG: polysaccharide lyase 8 family protein [Janthinobacterium lividum]